MRPDQAVGWTLNQTSAITAIVSSRIFFGNRLGNGTAGTIILPAINYFELPGTRRYNGFEFATFTFNCRATAASVAVQLSRLIIDLFHGTSSTGMYGSQNGFEITRSSLKYNQGLVYESDDMIYNAPVDILMVYPSSSVS